MKTMKIEANNLYFCGDIHGELKTFVWQVLYRYGIKDSGIIILGDFGAGFDDSLESTYNQIKEKLEKSNVVIYAIRGNHDNPEYFNGSHNFERLIFLKDYEILEYKDITILPIGGAHSIDITWRIEKNSESKKWGSHRRVWWENEHIQQKPLKELPSEVDIIISHTAPLQFEPVATRFPECPAEQYEKIIEERKYLDNILNNIKVDRWYYGHFHKSYSGSINSNVLYRGLNIMEIVESPEKIDHTIQGETK